MGNDDHRFTSHSSLAPTEGTLASLSLCLLQERLNENPSSPWDFPPSHLPLCFPPHCFWSWGKLPLPYAMGVDYSHSPRRLSYPGDKHGNCPCTGGSHTGWGELTGLSIVAIARLVPHPSRPVTAHTSHQGRFLKMLSSRPISHQFNRISRAGAWAFMFFLKAPPSSQK